MKRLTLLAAILLTGCSARTSPEVENALVQQRIVLEAIVKYIDNCQQKGICPIPEEGEAE